MKLILVLVGVFIGHSVALECFKCTTRTEDQECHNKITCDRTEQWCTKLVGKMGDVERDCTTATNVKDGDCRAEGREGHKSTQCYCKDDLCNSSTSISITWLAFAMVPFIIKFIN